MVVGNTEQRTADEERQELLRALGGKVKEFTVLHEVAQIAIESLDLDEILYNSLDRVTKLLAVQVAAIFLASEQEGKVIAVAHGDVSSKFLDKVKEQSNSYSITNRVALSGVPIVIEDISRYPQLVDISVRQEGLRSIAAVPLKSNGRVIGTLVIGSHDLHSFSSEDVQLLSVVSEGLGPALKNGELYGALQAKTRQLEAQNEELVARKQELTGKSRELQVSPLKLLSNRANSTLNEGKMRKRSLYECFNARVSGLWIYCAEGHPLQSGSLKLHIRRLERGDPLALHACQKCPDFDEICPPLSKEERGWANLVHRAVNG